MNWLGHKGVRLMQTFKVQSKKMQNKCRLFEVLSETFKPKYNDTILSLQYWKLTGDQNKMLMNRWSD